jgi:hypothetical protein
VRKLASTLTRHGGSCIGNSRVKLTNVADCVKRGLVKEGQDPQKVRGREGEERRIARGGEMYRFKSGGIELSRDQKEKGRGKE